MSALIVTPSKEKKNTSLPQIQITHEMNGSERKETIGQNVKITQRKDEKCTNDHGEAGTSAPGVADVLTPNRFSLIRF